MALALNRFDYFPELITSDTGKFRKQQQCRVVELVLLPNKASVIIVVKGEQESLLRKKLWRN